MVELKLLKSLLEHMISYSQASFFQGEGHGKKGSGTRLYAKYSP